MRIAPEGWPFALPWLLPALLLLWLRQPVWAGVCLLAGVATALFFRDPRRSFDGPDDVVVAPADGRILKVDEVDADFAGARRTRVVTFLSVFDVHLQRCPVGGEVVESRPRSGAKVAAFRPEADEVNEQRLTVIRTAAGEAIGIVQIAGLVARRVVGYLRQGERVERGQHLGLIKFGSRVDLLVPTGYIIEVGAGDRVRGGATAVARPGPRAHGDDATR